MELGTGKTEETTEKDDKQKGTIPDAMVIGVSCDDEGYETAGKKVLSLKSNKTNNKETRKMHDCPADDDGYETAGKKELVPVRVKSGDKQGRKSRGGSASPRCESKDKQDHKESINVRVHKLIDALEGIITVDQLNNGAVELLKLVPEGYIPLPHQVGGHRHIDGKMGFLRYQSQPNLLYKPVQAGSKGAREVSFYDALFGMSSSVGCPTEMFPILSKNKGSADAILPMIPKYHGLTSITDRAGTTYDYIVLEDITHKFTHPCILDLKIGQRVWDDFADKEKIEREKKKYPEQETLGFRIIGMRTYNPDSDEYVYYDRHYGRSVTEDTAKEAITHFFEVGDGSYHTDIIKTTLVKLAEIKKWMEAQDTLRMFATSLLIVYEGDRISNKLNNLDIRLVDFAHCYEKDDNNISDGNALYGVNYFTSFLEQIMHDLCID